MFSQYIFAEFEQVKKIVILLTLNKSKNNRSFADFEQVKKNNSYFADFEQVKKNNSCFATFEQVKNKLFC